MKVIGSLEVSKAVSRVSNDVDIRVFGAIGDGAADDTVPIQNAIASLGDTGGTVFFPKGTYKITAQTTLTSKDSIIFKGVGAGSIIRVTGVTGYAFVNSQCSNFNFKDIQFVGDGIGALNNHGALNFLKGVNPDNPNHIIDNVIIKDFSDVALQIQGSKGCKINNVSLENIGGKALRVFSGDSVNIEAVSVLNCDEAGIAIESMDYASVSDSKADGCGIGFQVLNSYGVTLQSCGGVNSSNNSVSYPGNAYEADNSQVTLIACFAESSDGDHLSSVNGGAFNYINFVDGDTNETSTVVNGTLLTSDEEFILFNAGDPTKKLKNDLSAIATATTRTASWQDVSGTVYISGGIDIPVTDGGTGASTALNARANLGLAIGTDIQAFSDLLAGIVALGGTTGMVSKTGASSYTARTITGTSSQVAVTNGSGVSGNPTLALASNPIIPGTASLTLPTGTTAQRPAGVNGMIRYNSTDQVLEGYINSTWATVSTSSNSNLKIGLNNITFVQGADSSIVKITGAANVALSVGNPGYVVMFDPTTGIFKTFTMTADVSLDLTGAHWSLGTKGDVVSVILRIYAIDDGNVLKWGVAYQGGFTTISNAQDSNLATSITAPENIFVNNAVSTNNSPVLDVGYIRANFADASDEWTITYYFPSMSADGQWQPWSTTFASGFSSAPVIDTARWTQHGKKVTAVMVIATAGTSNSSGFNLTSPTKALFNSATSVARITDNGTALTVPGCVSTFAASNTLTVRKDFTAVGSLFTAVNGKKADFTLEYEAYAPSGY